VSVGQILDRVLNRRGKHRIGARVTHDAIGGQAHPAGGCDHAAAPITEYVAIGCDLDRRRSGQDVGADDIGGAREMRAAP
jgi:hypothetical protein